MGRKSAAVGQEDPFRKEEAFAVFLPIGGHLEGLFQTGLEGGLAFWLQTVLKLLFENLVDTIAVQVQVDS